MVDNLKECSNNNLSGQHINATLLKHMYKIKGLKINDE